MGAFDRDLALMQEIYKAAWQDNWGFVPTAQWLANRGYAVLQVNYRGSTGFGKRLLNAGNLEWAAKIDKTMPTY